MRRSVPIAVLTSLMFMWAVLWPGVARARVTTAAAPAEAPEMVAAKQHFEAGRVAYNGSDYPTAIREFKAAEALRPSPILSYNIGLANEKLGRKRVAVRYYKRYLEAAPTAANKAEVDGRIATLEREIAAQPQQGTAGQETAQDNPPPMVQGDPNAPQVQNANDPYGGQPITTAPALKKKRSLWWVWLLVGVAGVALVTGIVVYAVLATQNNAVDATTFNGKVDLDRLRGNPRNELVERGAGMPAGQRGAEVAPVIQLHF